jgi:hypothetical protein
MFWSKKKELQLVVVCQDQGKIIFRWFKTTRDKADAHALNAYVALKNRGLNPIAALTRERGREWIVRLSVPDKELLRPLVFRRKLRFVRRFDDLALSAPTESPETD